jgi:RHS repeat-associated protein
MGARTEKIAFRRWIALAVALAALCMPIALRYAGLTAFDSDRSPDGPRSATYSYLANSPLVDHISFTNGGSWRMTTTKRYDFLNRLTSIASLGSDGSSLASFAYVYNAANQRTRSTLADGSYWLYAYDSLGQVKSGKKFWPDGTPVAGQQFEYAFDDIGNRTSTRAGGDNVGQNLRPASYSVNGLNQYTSRDVPGAVDVMGLELATNTVTVNGLTTYRKGEYFRKEVPVSNGSTGVWQSITVSATNETTVSGNQFVPKTPEQFAYDVDGNLTQDGHWNYGWDAENRLIALTNNASAAPAQVLHFEYDAKSRRIHKQVWNNGSGSGSAATDLKFLYDGWNLAAELTSANALVRTYLWGSDLSGSQQGAGGIGGLVAMSYHGSSTTNCFVAFDGNGNLSALVNAADGNSVAEYEYGPFGEVIRATGPMAKANPFRFSTKYQDDETDLLYYGYRYYNPSTGRWLSRDPLEEQAGPSLYAMVANCPVVVVDKLGRRVVVQPASAVGEVVELFNFLSDLQSWAEGAEIHSRCGSCWVSKYPTSWMCLCKAIQDTKTYTIHVETVGTTKWPMTYADGTTDMVDGPDHWPNTDVEEGDVFIPSKASQTYTFGSFDPSGNYVDAPLWRILGHELCGHAVFGFGYPATEISGDRPHHDLTIQVENDIAVEHGAPRRGLYSNPKQGESAWRATKGKTVYYKNKPRTGGPYGMQATDYKLTLP